MNVWSVVCLDMVIPYRDGGKLDELVPEDSGLFLADLKENTSELLISLSELVQMEDESYRRGYIHFVTHSEFSKDGRYLSFLYRKIPTDGDYMRAAYQDYGL